ncbi:hypothetical protein [Bradyrhizobium paxllaeri]|uniref:hypothetical protein n=1 Tax=Bradyrhizobium paxllaeri TaxID=190148 RepID=UPI00114741AD|nr:hypothetical protein [Bradyrhizobium paxllaeri]
MHDFKAQCRKGVAQPKLWPSHAPILILLDQLDRPRQMTVIDVAAVIARSLDAVAGIATVEQLVCDRPFEELANRVEKVPRLIV